MYIKTTIKAINQDYIVIALFLPFSKPYVKVNVQTDKTNPLLKKLLIRKQHNSDTQTQ
jgi:hypothetical protein